MEKSEIIPGAHYAFRERRIPNTPVQHVKAVKHIRGNKWKVQWIEPSPGLVDYAVSWQLVAPWGERHALLKEEESRARIEEYNKQQGYDAGSPVTKALEEVLDSFGENLELNNGSLRGEQDAIRRIKFRIGMDGDRRSSCSYADRRGLEWLPYDEALEIAKKFCATEPQAVLAGIEACENDWTTQVRSGGNMHLKPLLNEYQAAWAIVRQWTGHDPAVAAREARMQQLERLVWDAVYALQKAGLDLEADRLRRKLQPF